MHRVKVEDIRFTEVDAVKNFSEIFPPAGGKIVDATDLLPALQKSANKRRSDKPGRAGYQIFGHTHKS